MVFSRISSTLLRRRNPFTSKPISSFSSISSISSSPSNNFNLTTISKFHLQIFSNPRTTDFFQIRRYSAETPSLIAQGKKKPKKIPDPKEKKLAEYDRKVNLVYEAMEKVEYSKRSWVTWPSYKRNAKRVNNAVNNALKKYYEALSVLGEDERKDVEKANGWVINEMLDMQKKTMSDELINFDEVLKIWNKATFGEENPKGSGGTASYEALSVLGEDERKDVETANGWAINQMLDMQKKMMSDELMNFDEVLKIWNKATFGDEDQEGSGGTAC